jgi:aspartate aminotransferase
MDLSNRLLQVPASPIRKLVPYANDAKKQAIKVFHLNIGDPDIKTPEVMLDVLTKWVRNPIGYDQSQGNPGFVSSLVSYYQNLGFAFIETKNIQVTTGGSEAISMAMFAVCEPGEEIIVFEPFYANYQSFAVVNGVKLVPVKTSISNGFHLPPDSHIESVISDKTRAILICNPNNPTGTVYTRDEMDRLVALVRAHNLYLLSDEVYREFTYDGKKHISAFLYMNILPKQIIVLDSLSKRYSLCGARLGALVSLNEELMAGVLKIGQGRLSSGLIDQIMAAKLTEVPHSYFDEVQTEYEKRRNVLYDGLTKISGIRVAKPEGAFYAIVELPVPDAEKFCKWLLTDFRDQNETIMIAPASGFYATSGYGKREVRIAYVINCEDLTRSLEILAKALDIYPEKLK